MINLPDYTGLFPSSLCTNPFPFNNLGFVDGHILARAGFRAKWCPDSPWVFCDRQGKRVQNVRRRFMTACKRAQISDFHIHDLRHTCAAWLVSAGVPLTEVRDLLGHAKVKMTEKYAHLHPENVRAAVARLDGESRSSHVADLTGLLGKANAMLAFDISKEIWWPGTESNCRHGDFQSPALPTELPGRGEGSIKLGQTAHVKSVLVLHRVERIPPAWRFLHQRGIFPVPGPEIP